MRFRPSGGLGHGQQKTDKEATQARAEAVGETSGGGPERLFERRHVHEIERAENIAAGLPPQGATEPVTETPANIPEKKDFREPHLETPAVVEEEKFAPVAIKEQPKGLIETIKATAANLVKKVQKLIRPEKKVHKEVIINAETLETRVAVTEDGKLEEFNIERTTEERLVGSIFKGKVRNLDEILSYDPPSNRWSTLGRLPFALRGARGLVMGEPRNAEARGVEHRSPGAHRRRSPARLSPDTRRDRFHPRSSPLSFTCR